MSKVVAFLPARCGSKSIKEKNIKLFCGKPLLYWNLQELQNTKQVSKVYVATDCDKIEQIVHSFCFSKVSVYRRALENARDESSTESVILEFLAQNEIVSEFDTLMLVQATSPLTSRNDFEGAINLYLTKSYDSVLSCVRLKRFFWTEEGQPVNYNFNQRPRRQDFTGILAENGAFYINSVNNILRDQCRLSGKVGVYEMSEYTFTELDEEHDWTIAELLMKKYFRFIDKHPPIKLFASDVDGVLTDAGMYYSEKGDELKKFNTHDGKGFELLRNSGVKTAIITSENTTLVSRRAEKLKVDYLYQGKSNESKLNALKDICRKENIALENVAYIGDDVNCIETLQSVGWPGCPADAVAEVKSISGITLLDKKGGEGVVREFIEKILSHNKKQ